MSMLEWRQFITQFEGRLPWLEMVFKPEFNLTNDVMNSFIKPRMPDQPPRTQDTNIFAPKGLGKSYFLGNVKECYRDTFSEDFDWTTWFQSPTQFLILTENLKSEDEISNKFLAIDEPRIRERGEGSGALWDRFMNTRSTIRPRRTVICQASERYVATSPNLVIKPIYLDERNSSLMSLVLSPDTYKCYGAMFSGKPSDRWCKTYDQLRLDFEKQVREDKSEVRAYWEPIAMDLIEKYDYKTKTTEIKEFTEQLELWAMDKKSQPKPQRPHFMGTKGTISEKRIVQDARYEKKLSSTEYEFLASLVLDLLGDQ